MTIKIFHHKFGS